MHRAYVPIENALLRQLYVDERLTAEVIAARIGCSPMTILRRLRKYGIRARSRGPLQQAKTLNGDLTWSANLAWAVGLMATDGNLSGDGRHLSLVSKDRELLETFRACLNLDVAIAPHASGHGRCALRVQWSDRRFYDWLMDVGLRPAKSLTLRPLAIPDECFVDFFRGCIDGDDSIVTYIDRYNTFKKPQYVYSLYVSIVSASLQFVDWLKTTVRRLTGLAGELTVRRVPTRNDLWRLRFAKGGSVALLRWMSYSPDLPCLHRKRATAAAFLVPSERPRRRGPGRPMVV